MRYRILLSHIFLFGTEMNDNATKNYYIKRDNFVSLRYGALSGTNNKYL